MSKLKRLFDRQVRFFAAVLIAALTLSPAGGMAALDVNKQETGLYKDVFETNIYYEGTGYLRMDRLYRAIFRLQEESKNVNVYDEVPDSGFFVNRHGRSRMSTDELARGYRETEGLDTGSSLTVTKGKFEGLHPGFFIRDQKGDEYLIKFDPFDYFELTTSAEVIASRFYYAIGYNVPQYTIAVIDPEKFEVGEGAKVLDESGFKKPLTEDKLQELLLFVPRNDEGMFRVSASKILEGENMGSFRFYGTRPGDPADAVAHEDRREIRALQVFSAWLNNSDVRESNTLDMLQQGENGEEVLKHYLIDFNTSLGAAAKGPKPPSFGHEYMIDYGSIFKAFAALGFWKKPWQKRLEEAGEPSIVSPAVGYFDNRYFRPDDYKTQYPYYAFKDVTPADGFWAAKIIQSFTDEDIRAIVGAGELSLPEDQEYLVRTLAERRDLIASYWFQQVSPLDRFVYSGNTLSFSDLAVQAGYAGRENVQYAYDVISREGKKGRRVFSGSSSGPSIEISPEWFSDAGETDLLIRAVRGGSEPLPYVLVTLSGGKILRIRHQG